LEQLKFPAAPLQRILIKATPMGVLRRPKVGFATSEALSVQPKLKYPQLANVVFLDRVGQTLREATSDIPHQELPEDIQRLLRRLERIEIRNARKEADE
jgi:hypothetical protein